MKNGYLFAKEYKNHTLFIPYMESESYIRNFY